MFVHVTLGSTLRHLGPFNFCPFGALCFCPLDPHRLAGVQHAGLHLSSVDRLRRVDLGRVAQLLRGCPVVESGQRNRTMRATCTAQQVQQNWCSGSITNVC